MKTANIILKTILLSLITYVTMAQSPKQIPLSDFFKNSEKAKFSLSPDGNYIAFLAPYEK